MPEITPSLPQDLVDFADDVARYADISRSQVIGKAVAEEGYCFYASESIEFAQASALAVAEAISTHFWLDDGR